MKPHYSELDVLICTVPLACCSVCDKMIFQLCERVKDFHTSHWATGERRHSLSFFSLWKSILTFYVFIHVSLWLPLEMPEAQICIHLNWVERFGILCQTSHTDLGTVDSGGFDSHKVDFLYLASIILQALMFYKDFWLPLVVISGMYMATIVSGALMTEG